MALEQVTDQCSAVGTAAWTAGRQLPTEMLTQIIDKTDGVPLFIEELTKMVLESGLLVEDDGRYRLDSPLPPLAIPATLQDSLMARLDRLAPVKEVAQTGAAIGRDFSYALLRSLAGRDDVGVDGALLGPWNPWLHEPKFGKPVWELTKAMAFDPSLPAAVHEIAILLTGAHFRSAYELYAHVIVAERKGLSDEKLATFVAGQRPVDLTKQEAMTDSAIRNRQAHEDQQEIFDASTYGSARRF